jgi:Tfp pilus assembly protein PilF
MTGFTESLAAPNVGPPRVETVPGEKLHLSSDGLRSACPRRRRWRTFQWLCATVLGLALIGGAGIYLQERRAVERDVRAARAAIAAGRPALALEPLRRWLRARPKSAEAHALQAEVAVAKASFPEVKREYNEARACGYSEEKLERIRAIWWAALGRFPEALPTLYRLSIERREPDPAVDEALARVYLKTYRLHQARAVINRWIEDAPADGRPFLWLTEIDRRTEFDNPETAERHYRAALARDPQLDPARLGLAETLRKVHRNEEAAGPYGQYLASHPDDPVALAGAGLNALELADLAGAARFLDRAVAVAPTHTTVLKARAQLAMQGGDLGAARKWLDQAVEADRFDEEAFYLRTRVRTLLGDAAGAAADVAVFNQLKHDQEELLKMHAQLVSHPEDTDTRSRTAAWLFEHGREHDGLEWALAILASHPDHGPTCRLLADYYGKQPDGSGLANFYRLKAATKTTVPR